MGCFNLASAQNVKLSGGEDFSQVLGFKMSPNGEYAVYLQDGETSGVYKLWSVPTRGGATCSSRDPI